MHTATRQDWLIGYTRNGNPVFAIAGADDGAGSGDGGDGGGAGGDGADGKSGGDGKGDPPEFKSIESQDALDKIVQARLARERTKFADYDDVKKKASEFDKMTEAQKSELQKATDKLAKAEGLASEAELRAMRLEVAIDKGLTPTQAKRLVGKSKEELEADADDLIDSFKSNDDDGKKTTLGNRKERLRGGADPTEEVEETDPRKLAARVDRL